MSQDVRGGNVSSIQALQGWILLLELPRIIPRFSSHHLCLPIVIRPFPVGTRKTPSLRWWKPPLTGYYCVFHRPDPFTTATHVNWRSYEQQWGAGILNQWNNTTTKEPVSTISPSNLLWMHYLLTTPLQARAALLGYRERSRKEPARTFRKSFRSRAHGSTLQDLKPKYVDRAPGW